MEIQAPKKTEKYGFLDYNACSSYMNASLQMLRSIPELNEMVKGLKNSPEQDKMIPSFIMYTFKKI